MDYASFPWVRWSDARLRGNVGPWTRGERAAQGACPIASVWSPPTAMSRGYRFRVDAPACHRLSSGKVYLRRRSWGMSDIGRRREGNEDAFVADDTLGLYVVA